MKLWHGKGIKIVVYLDNGIGAAKGIADAEAASSLVKGTLAQVDLVAHPKKCHWEPSQMVKWLGFNIDLDTGCLSVPLEKLASIKDRLAEAIAQDWIQAGQLHL